jgi:transcriptional regulator with XRE-family HTH domain
VKTIQELREIYGWSHWELAVRLGVRPGMLKDWEAGKSRPRAIHLTRLAEIFGVDKSYIKLDVEPVDDAESGSGSA